MFDRLREDLRVVREQDPACRSTLEILFCYPGFKALRDHRLAHALWRRGFHFLARYLSERSRRKTGIEIHPAAKIGRRVFIDHGTGIVIGETAEVGNDVLLYQGVTLGGTGKEKGKRHPTIMDHVVISTGAKVLGNITVGSYAKVGAGAVVVKPVPPHSTVVGVPGRVVRRDGVRVDPLAHGNLPDPVLETMNRLTREVSELKERIRQLETKEEDARAHGAETA